LFSLPVEGVKPWTISLGGDEREEAEWETGGAASGLNV
jgi:hypothetical protein